MGIAKFFNPIIFQGNLRKKNYFEGWYFKIVDASSENIYAFIPGIFLEKNGKDSHAFIQIINGITQETEYLSYDLKDFSYSKKYFYVKILENIFSEEGMIFKGDRIQVKLKFKNHSKWPKSLIGRNAMGIFGLIPFMQCNHGIFSMDYLLEGTMNINGKKIDFTGGRGYSEKDWGYSFPDSWIWIQSNHFEKNKTSLSISLASVPLLFTNITGFICGFLLEGKQYTFATYNASRITKLEVNENIVEINFLRKNLLLEVVLEKEGGGILASPDGNNMGGRISESLTSKVNVKLYKNSELIFQGKGENCGSEIEGKYKESDKI